MFGSIAAFANQGTRTLSWECLGTFNKGDDTFHEFDFEQVVDDYRGEAKVLEQVIQLKSSNGLYDHYGPAPTKVIDLNSKFVCPNTREVIYSVSTVTSINQDPDFSDAISPLSIELIQGCGDGLGELIVKGFCRFSH